MFFLQFCEVDGFEEGLGPDVARHGVRHAEPLGRALLQQQQQDLQPAKHHSVKCNLRKKYFWGETIFVAGWDYQMCFCTPGCIVADLFGLAREEPREVSSLVTDGPEQLVLVTPEGQRITTVCRYNQLEKLEAAKAA